MQDARADPVSGGILMDLLRAFVARASLVHVFAKGGPIMVPLVFASILGLGTVIERVQFLLDERRKRDPQGLDAFFEAVTRGQADQAAAMGARSQFFVLRALGYALGHRQRSLASAL